ncbi:hypothetical protein [Fodinicurvata sediminis]|uniref:hypothetical protein n=1 Tax=Fodinicurvata sediminis TaxID=1121832 RepID=UPI0003B4968F|nr:hypothetical protein [Fodinicurvata sediminis]
MNPNIKTGTVEGTGSAINVALGFQPDHVRIFNIDATNPVSVEWTSDMDDGHGLKLKGGTVAYSKITSNGITPYDGADNDEGYGFTIGADSDLNVNNQTLVYVATRSGAGAA